LSEGIFTALASCVPAAALAFVLTLFVDKSIGNMMFHASLPLRVSTPRDSRCTAVLAPRTQFR
jgi:hypothetical protein